ncbi:STAS domain-containing protein [Alkalilimnicola ehrlichii]|uniref:STAS domain-containing protein n=1 Tax=Alkalilimnicola ehrlichii TaxID=351052 RepID=UPI001C6E84CB|nr:sodium-independent anion transporter [Alkalilimnicola ehrlichii]
MIAVAATEQRELRHLVLICSAVNAIDHSAMESLQQLAESLKEAGIILHLAEVKGPVMDRLRQSDLLKHLAPGQIFLSTEEAVETLAGKTLL